MLAEARQDGLTDDEILARSPTVLALAPPRVAPKPELPEEATALHVTTTCQNCGDNGIIREALRLRVRWVQEISGRAACELGARLAKVKDLTEPELIRHMTLEQVEAVATKRAVVVPPLVDMHAHDFGAPLPAWFQLSDRGKPIRVQCAGEVGGGTGAGGGTGKRTGDLQRGRPADRLGARDNDVVAGPRSVAAAAQGDRRRDGLGAVTPRDPGP